MIGGVARSRARYLAPVALVGAVVATVLVVSNGVHSKSSKPPATSTVHTDGSHGTARARRVRHRAAYVVRSGDTLSAIALKTGVPVATLESLNPGINPAALQTGQHLKLR